MDDFCPRLHMKFILFDKSCRQNLGIWELRGMKTTNKYVRVKSRLPCLAKGFRCRANRIVTEAHWGRDVFFLRVPNTLP